MLLILLLILTYHVVSNEMKRTSSNSLRSASWTWHISAPIFCIFFLSLIAPFHIRLAHPHRPHQTPSLNPCRANVAASQFQVCQGRVVLQSLCQCLTGGKSLRVGKILRTQGQLSKCRKARVLSSFRNLCYDLQCTMSPCVKTAVAKTSSPGCEALLNDHLAA